MLEYSTGDPFILDHGDQAHRPLTPSAGQHIDGVRALQQDGPFQPSMATDVIGTDNLVSLRMNR